MFQHKTVLREEAVDGLAVKPDGIYVDCTLGGAGHSELIASRLTSEGRLIALDQDEWAHEHARSRLAPYWDRVTLVKSNFRFLEEALRGAGVPVNGSGVPAVDGVLFDLGVSSPQLDEAERGFSYNHDAPLDMRMDRSSGLTAYDIVNGWEEKEISRILHVYGEERFARSIARRIAQVRAARPVATTGELAELIKEAIPAAARRTGPHPAKRSFQALRIAVNDELGAEAEALEQAIRCLKPGGRIAVITFHSLEDRICKQTFARYAGTCTCPPDFPVCVCGGKGVLKLVNRKPITPSEEELKDNPRARSAKLRIAEKRAED
ncbi:ribosomal RNA small subunit methyltransferase H [Paenibacillus cisolokensis]|uniref:Ribosomal RNA small subunit methyltransferase H n=1 Tax=Paenibacillus cisolokensis TaxID=1658519 RepID=A0ABQ4N7I8_9BACL|nr:16S rRNA (cytosine(1402)-N(4))-methyltransferase RsmH [Paenibacillus cisolokensis]GIQ64129.1 ribosomal RNA small subunit methyltransferase H [Paenibacillus cisolokensis]